MKLTTHKLILKDKWTV